MKEVVLITIYFLFGILLFFLIKITNLKEYNHKLKNEIKGSQMNNIALKEEITKYKEQIEILKENNKDKWNELTIWKNTESKIQKALSH